MTFTELTETDFLQSIWQALRRIEAALSALTFPPPEVSITAPPPDLADIVTAVTSLKPGPSAEDIARALADVLAPGAPDGTPDALGEVARALEKLDFRLQGMGTQAYGGGSVTLQRGQEVTVANPTADPETGLAKDATLTGRLPDLVGTWSYYAGASGTVTVTAGQRVIGIAAHATVAGSMTIDGGTSIPIPANTGIAFTPQGNLVAPTIVFTSTDSYTVETLT